jgi:hypothetical protein
MHEIFDLYEVYNITTHGLVRTDSFVANQFRDYILIGKNN